MNFDDLCIKAHDSRLDVYALVDLIHEVDFKNYTENQHTYIKFMFGTYIDEAVTLDVSKVNEAIKKLQNMQYTKEDYDDQKHDWYKALSVKQPLADKLATGQTKVLLKMKNTRHRGNVVLCSTSHKVNGFDNGCTLAILDLHKVKQVKYFTRQDWLSANIPESARSNFSNHFGWFFKDPIRIVEYPVKGGSGLWNLIVDNLEIIPYLKEIPLPKKPESSNIWTLSNAKIFAYVFYIFVTVGVIGGLILIYSLIYG